MCGSGNLLDSLIRYGLESNNVLGIEIDPQYASLNHPYKVFNSDAFKPDLYSNLETPFDLVISNPPYVRYQDINKNVSGVERIGSREIKTNLKKIITSFNHLDKTEKTALIDLVDSYSGLSNLAIPCWILCMALVSPGGTLSLVVPETWLTREYAIPLKQTLLQLFDVRFLVVDNSPSWFNDAEAKTNLIVLKKKTDLKNHKMCKISLDRKAMGERSIIEFAKIENKKGDEIIDYIISNRIPSFTENISLEYLDQNTLSNDGNIIEIILSKEGISIDNSFVSLESLGLHISQGLRTGANIFFHVRLVENNLMNSIVFSMFDKKSHLISNEYLRPLIKHIKEKPDDLFISSDSTNDRLLYIQQEIEKNSELYSYIEFVKRTSIKVKGKETTVPALSAVRVNESGSRRWYMLPVLKPRHIPELFVPRIIYQNLNCYMNDGNVVDANFITIHLDNHSRIDKFAAFALLNSTWVKFCAEVLGTRFSAGALKLEAIQIKKIPMPDFSENQYSLLSEYGKLLLSDRNIISKIDNLIYNTISKNNGKHVSNIINSLLSNMVINRSRDRDNNQ